mmetsp:Transcript_14012/g.17164  ORF Transcript_14012/g.17164 Transcript_14012/m.17164 type:complete len:262 (-) Transcript_14012:402-1187(-)
MDRAVQARPKYIGHARVEFEEGVAPLPRGEDLILHGAHQGPGVSHQKRPGLDLQGQIPSHLLLESFESLFHRSTDALQIGRLFVGIASDLVPTSEIARGDAVPDLAKAQTFGRHALPDLRIGPRTDVRVDAFHHQSVLTHDRFRFSAGDQLVPDPETRGWTAHVGFGEGGCGFRKSTGSDSRVYPDPHILGFSGVGFPDPGELVEGARVHLHADIHECCEISGEFLGGEGNVLRGDSCLHGAAYLESARCVDVDPGLVEEG